MLGGTPAVEPRQREVEGAPEEMRGTRFPEEASAEPFQDSVRVHQHPEEAMGMRPVVRGVKAVLGKRNRVLRLDRHGPQLHGDAERSEQRHVVTIEVRDRLRSQRDLPDRPVTRLHEEPVVDEVELHFERARAVWHGTRRQSPGRDVQRHVPPMVLLGRQGEPGLPDDLHPHVQRVMRVLPFGERQARPRRLDVVSFWHGHHFLSRSSSNGAT